MNVNTRRSMLMTALVLALVVACASTALGNPMSAPRSRLSRGTSTNWSGYAAETSLASPQSGAVSDVVGTWQVPFVAGTLNAWSSAWVGIDGYSSGTVEQIGTEQDTTVSGATRYYAWYEMYPAGSALIRGFAVNPGNIIAAEVKYVSGKKYTLTLVNRSTGKTYKVTKSASAQRSSAEWVMEAPWSGGVLPLANFGVIGFTGCKATVNGLTGPINQTANDPVTMVTDGANSVTKAAPSALSPDGTTFGVAWYHQ